jgi:pimeloyl-ACP methyl ester carboxylesterase
MTCRWALVSLSLIVLPARADGPSDNIPARVRPIPPAGIRLTDADRAELEAGAHRLGQEIDALRATLKLRPELLELLPDVQIFHAAVSTALLHNEFFDTRETAWTRELLRRGMERASALRDGKAPWNTAIGLVVRGYVSRIDGSVQPYGLIVPPSFTPTTPHRFRLDVWCHGRSETLSEVNFLHDRQTSPGQFTPPHAFVLHPYGRYCNANKFAGEIDLFEALEDVKSHYPIDDNRLVMRGFSMGGAACWQFAVHYPDRWAAAAPGAGFAETPGFLRIFQDEKMKPAWYEKQLWHLYDCTDYAANLFNCPTVAYSGEKDRQKQAADVMEDALKYEGIDLVHIIGAGAGHQYTPEAKVEINRRIDAIARVGRNPLPAEVRFTTWTLRYNRCSWVQIDGLEKHWERARVEAEFPHDIWTRNVSALTLDVPPGLFPPDLTREEGGRPAIHIGEDHVEGPPLQSDRSWTVHLRKVDGKWQAVKSADDGALRKRHGLQGPIDDAFMDSFLMVRPTGKPQSERVGKWTTDEMRHAIEHWRRQFRGEARVKDDSQVDAADIAAHNLVLWGDPSSNAILAKIAEKLPVKWNKDQIRLGDESFPSDHHIPILIYPNPLNPRRYVVLNSGFTFREYDYLNNARQVPKLPDYAVVDILVPVSSTSPGRIAAAGFFTERWELPTKGNGDSR